MTQSIGQATFELLIKETPAVVFITSVGIKVVVTVIPYVLLSEVNSADDSETLIQTYIVCTLMANLYARWYEYYVRAITQQMMRRFIIRELDRYRSLSFVSKSKTSSQKFNSLLLSAAWTISAMMKWGISTIISTFSTILGTIVAFYQEGMTGMLVVMLVANLIVYFVFTRRYQHQYTKTRISNSCRRSQIFALKNFELMRLESGAVSLQLNELTLELFDQDFDLQNKWTVIGTITQMVNRVPLLMLLFNTPDSKRFLFFLSIFSRFSGSIQATTGFFNSYSGKVLKYAEYQRLWDHKVFRSEPEKHDIPPHLTIAHSAVSQGKFHITIPRFTIRQGDRILIQAPSASGKSTFIKALLGKLPGLEFENTTSKPENFYHSVSEFFQEAKEKMSDKITLHQFFPSNLSDSQIKKYLDIAMIGDIVDNLEPPEEPLIPSEPSMMESIVKLMPLFKPPKKAKVEPEPLAPELMVSEPRMAKEELPNKFDYPIGGLSGGQKTRLALARVVCCAEASRWLVLDEPEQGLDQIALPGSEPLAYSVMNNILTWARDRHLTVLMISHLERISKQHDWTHVMHVDVGCNESTLVIK